MEATFQASKRTLCVFCGSSPGARPEYMRAARDFGRLLVARGYDLVYGGSSVGVMTAVADAVLECGGRVTGVIPEAFVRKEIAHSGLTELRVVGSMHERKALMADLSDGFVGLPGGLGTLEEFFEVVTWAQLGIHEKPCGLLNACGYFDDLSRFLDHIVDEAFLKPEHRATILVEDDAERLLDRLEGVVPPRVEKWIRPDQA